MPKSFDRAIANKVCRGMFTAMNFAFFWSYFLFLNNESRLAFNAQGYI